MSLRDQDFTSHPKPLQALLGGIGIALSIHALLVLNGTVLGVSGFIHRSFRGDKAAIFSVAGLALGGITVGIASNVNPPEPGAASPFIQTLLSGLLVGIGTKLANGCTSGHMICGLSHLSFRSLVATAMFFAGAVPATHLAHGDALGISGSLDWSLDNQGRYFLGAALSLGALWLAYICTTVKSGACDSSEPSVIHYLASFLTSLAFAFSLRLGNMVDPHKVLTFLISPFSSAFDPSLVFLAGSALPLAALLHRYAGVEKPSFSGNPNIPTSTKIDLRLVLGSVIFGMGWGISGVCPGPALVNFGHSLYTGAGFMKNAAWLVSMVLGGLLVE
ncbi:hypothetical protein M405DRAFT_802900 [Rhizopogon salebrosus TDB-379]|nr:hypothetical protein M405DRAFT_802900 [Rhizopogon salebrosus TDB-379]